jgi:hypothetical protein
MDLQSALALIFKSAKRPTYLHIGAHDGVTDNPTYLLYRLGWRGVCVEPLTKYFKKGVEERPEDRWIKGVCVDREYTNKRVSIWYDPSGRFAALDNLEELAIIYWQQENPGKPFPGMKKSSLKPIKINDDVPRGRFTDGLDLLVIDINGSEQVALSTIDLGLWKPHIVAIPSGWQLDGVMDAYFNMMGYFRIGEGKIEDWLVYSNDLRDAHAL